MFWLLNRATSQLAAYQIARIIKPLFFYSMLGISMIKPDIATDPFVACPTNLHNALASCCLDIGSLCLCQMLFYLSIRHSQFGCSSLGSTRFCEGYISMASGQANQYETFGNPINMKVSPTESINIASSSSAILILCSSSLLLLLSSSCPACCSPPAWLWVRAAPSMALPMAPAMPQCLWSVKWV